jgi:molybdate transport system substrate-binding protein
MPAFLAVLVASAISVKAPVEEAAAAFGLADPGEAITVQGAASGVLVAQAESGAPFDLFVSASAAELDRLAKGGRLIPGTRVAVATNRLVTIVRKGLAPPETIDGLDDPRFQRIAIGNPRTVPAGRYAAQALKSRGLLPRLEGRVILAENVRQALDEVVRGEVDAAFVYATEAQLAGTRVTSGPDVPGVLHDPIVYEAACVRGEKDVPRAEAFLRFLSSDAGRAIFAKQGFGPPPPR